MKIETSINKLQACLSDKQKQRFVVLELNINFSMENETAKSVKELRAYFRESEDKLIQSQMIISLKDFNIYSCKIQNGEYTNKREILKPFKLFCELKTYYEMRSLGLQAVFSLFTAPNNKPAKKAEIFLETTDINVISSKIMFFASLVDLLSLDVIMKDNLKDLADHSASEAKKEKKRK